jgi:hypothetical protein
VVDTARIIKCIVAVMNVMKIISQIAGTATLRISTIIVES